MMGGPMEVEADTATPAGGGIMTAPGPPTHSTVKRAIAPVILRRSSATRWSSVPPRSRWMTIRMSSPRSTMPLRPATSLVQFCSLRPSNARCLRGPGIDSRRCTARHERSCVRLRRVDPGGANVNAQTDPQGYARPCTPAALAGHVEALRVLLGRRCRPEPAEPTATRPPPRRPREGGRWGGCWRGEGGRAEEAGTGGEGERGGGRGSGEGEGGPGRGYGPNGAE